MQGNGKNRRQMGFSLMELLICVSIMTVIMGAAFVLLGRSLNFANITYHMTEAEQGLRTGHEVINRDLTTTGDGLRGMNMIKVPIFFVQNYLTKTPVVDPNTPNYPNLGLLTSDDNVPANTSVLQSNPAKSVMGGTDRTSVLMQDTSFAAITLLAGKITYSGSNTNVVVAAAEIGRFQAGEIYAIASGNSIAFAVISTINLGANTLVLTNGDVYGINETGPNAPIYVVSQINATTKASTQPASIIRVQIVHYFLTSDKLLMRRVFGVKGAGFVDSVVAEHITSLQFRYMLGTTDATGFVAQPVRQLSLTNQAGVRQVEASLTIETVRAVNRANSNNNGHQTITSTQGTTVRNLQFRQAT